jgi:hypothetical protein
LVGSQESLKAMIGTLVQDQKKEIRSFETAIRMYKLSNYLPEKAISGKTSRSRSAGRAVSRIVSARWMLPSTSPTVGANCKQPILIMKLDNHNFLVGLGSHSAVQPVVKKPASVSNTDEK